ncbi:hypothetical protein C8R44DRAFT_745257 [Mycena epipterygia]|nr:hypothetical protein C8R44DRAFT_745257 [Mycena epipterygia]
MFASASASARALSLVVHVLLISLYFPIAARRLANTSYPHIPTFAAVHAQSSTEHGLTHSHTLSFTVILGVMSLTSHERITERIPVKFWRPERRGFALTRQAAAGCWAGSEVAKKVGASIARLERREEEIQGMRHGCQLAADGVGCPFTIDFVHSSHATYLQAHLFHHKNPTVVKWNHCYDRPDRFHLDDLHGCRFI